MTTSLCCTMPFLATDFTTEFTCIGLTNEQICAHPCRADNWEPRSITGDEPDVDLEGSEAEEEEIEEDEK